MSHFFFHVAGRPDETGTELPSIAAAKCEAVRYAGKLICDEADTFWDSAEFGLIVTDETGLVLFTLTLSGLEAPAIRMTGR